MSRIIVAILVICAIIGAWFVYSEIYIAGALLADKIHFEVKKGESASALAARLEKEQVIRNAFLFRQYLKLKNLDTKIGHGFFEVEKPITLIRVAEALRNPSAQEFEITIIPGWDLRDVQEYFINSEIGSDLSGLGEQDKRSRISQIIGIPAVDYRALASSFTGEFDYKVTESKPGYVSYEGYIRPDTYRVYKDAAVEEIFSKLIKARNSEFTDEMYGDIEKDGRTVHEILTMASLLEREVRDVKDRAKVADLFWRRHDVGMGLQADSSVHYSVGKKGDMFTTKEDRDTINPWNTYKYPRLPLGPISNPGIDSIMAAIHPEKNDYWYFLTTIDTGEVKYAETLEEHNQNVRKYLRN